jgi:hypothetical protein
MPHLDAAFPMFVLFEVRRAALLKIGRKRQLTAGSMSDFCRGDCD